MKNTILIILMLAVSCLTVDLTTSNRKVDSYTKTREVMVDPLLQSYVLEFHDAMSNAGIEINYGSIVVIKFSSHMNPKVLGMAIGMTHDTSTIININSRLFFSLTHQQRRLLIFHEMAHDVFNLYHGSIGLMDTPMPKYVTKDMVDGHLLELIKHIKNGR